MRQILGGLLVLILCSAAGGETASITLDARLLQARADLENAKKAQSTGDYAHALEWAQDALRRREAVLGGTHPDVAACLLVMDEIYGHQKQLSPAEESFWRAITLWKSAPSGSHLLAANALDRLALLYSDLGLYDKAEEQYWQALAISQEAADDDQLKTASILQHLADLYRTRGLYEKAESLYLQALDIRKKALGETHPQVAMTFNHLAALYEKQGLLQKAESLYILAIYSIKATLGDQHPEFATALKGIASIYRKKGSNGAAEKFLLEVLKIRETSLGPTHPSVASVLELLARLDWKRGEYKKAKPLYARALAIREEASSKDHILVAHILNDIAHLHQSQGEYLEAENKYRRALAIKEKLGENHPSVANTLNDLAQLLLAQNRLSEALPLLTRAFAISEQRLRQEALGFSESRLAEFLYRMHDREQVLYSLVHAYPDDARVRRLALSSVLLLKGRSVEEITSIYHILHQRLGPKGRELLERQRGLRVELANRSRAGQDVAPAREPGPDKLTEKSDQLEAEIAGNVAAMRALTTLPRPEDIVDTVAKSLPEDSALVEFIVYQDRPLAPPIGASHVEITRQLHDHYMALVLFPDASTRAVDLGLIEPIDASVKSLVVRLSELKQGNDNHDTDVQDAAQELYQLIWKPLMPLLGSTRRIWLSPDSQLNRVPFYALHDGHDFLLDTFTFTYLTSGKQLLSLSQEKPLASSVSVLALPDDGLKGVKSELKSIQRLLPQSKIFLNSQATRGLLFSLLSPGILHISAHGDVWSDVLGEHPSSGPPKRSQYSIPGDPPPTHLQEPMLGSSIFLADPLNAPLDSTSRVKTKRVTALELAGLNLWGTQLVVLSACVSGLGHIQPGQGVYGMRRALEMAGAETLVMSLWDVADDSTPVLMEHYYRNLKKGRGRSSALREAIQEMRDRYPDPNRWAPFIAQGSDAPLRGITFGSPSVSHEDENPAENTSQKSVPLLDQGVSAGDTVDPLAHMGARN